MRPCYMPVKSQPYGTVRNMPAPAAALAEAPPPQPLPRSRDRDARRKSILDVARDAFMREGYAAVSMSAISARLGGSKGTLYNYFASKEDLFAAVVQENCEAEFLATVSFQPDEALEQSLTRFGLRFMRFALSDVALGFHRLISAEAVRFPELGRLFYAAGPERTVERLAGLLLEQMDAGLLRPSDPSRAASFLLGLLKSNIHHRRVWNVLEPLSEGELELHVDEAVRVFLHGYAAA